MAIKATKKRKHAGSTKSASAKGQVAKAEECSATVSTSSSPPHVADYHFTHVIDVSKLTDQVLHYQQLSLIDPFDIPQVSMFDVFRTSQVVRNEILSRQWRPIWSSVVHSDFGDAQCPFVRFAVDRAVFAAVRMVDLQMLACILPPTVLPTSLRGTHAMLSAIKWAVEMMDHTHVMQGRLEPSGNQGDFRNAIGDLALAGLDDDLVFANMALLRAEHSGRNSVANTSISQVVDELRRHRVIDLHDLTDDLLIMRQGAEVFVTGTSHKAVVAEWTRISHAAKEADLELRPWEDPAETAFDGWWRNVAGFGFGVAENKVSISILDSSYAVLESELEGAACSHNPHFRARFAIEGWLKRHAPGIELQNEDETLAELRRVLNRTGFASLSKDRELYAALDRAKQRWINDRDDEHDESFITLSTTGRLEGHRG